MYGNRVADESASKFNVTWSRVSPVCVSLCNDYNCLYITGDSNHIMGREAVGNASGVWKFNFATSFSFSLIEQLVGNNVWNTTKIGSVTLGLMESYMNNETLELFASNSYIFIKHASDNNTLLFLDLKTGIVRDCFSYYGLLGTMPCYHDNITDNAWKYGNNLLDKVSKEFSDLKNIFTISILSSVFVEGGVFAFEGLAGLSLGATAVIMIPLFIVLFPDHANELWKEFMHLLNPNYKDYPNIHITNDYQTQLDILNITNVLYLNQYTLIDTIIILDNFKKHPYDKPTLENYRKMLIDSRKSQKLNFGPSGGSPNSTGGTVGDVGKYIKELHEEYKSLETTSEKIIFIKNHILNIFTIGLKIETIDLIYDLINLLLYELSKDIPNNSTKS